MVHVVKPLIRSFLYVPADSGDRLTRAGMRGADAVIVDLEDSVAPARKAVARTAAAEWITGNAERTNFERWIRVRPGDVGIEDLQAVFRPGLDGVCVAKASSASEVLAADRALRELESQFGCTAGSTALMPLIESGLGLRRIDEIASGPRVRILQLGEVDLAADLALPASPNPEDLAVLRSTVIVASAAAGLEPPVGAVSPQFRDVEAFRASTARLKAAGFMGRAAIHPNQLPIIHDVFTVSSLDLAAARVALSRYETLLADGRGAGLDAEGAMVDEASMRRSRRIIALASAAELAAREE